MTRQSKEIDGAIDLDELQVAIRSMYRSVAADPRAGYHFFTGKKAADHVGYPSDVLNDLPDDVVSAFAGVANPFHWGMPAPGATVVDVGCGAGLDSLIASRAVGLDGSVIGVDMTPDMLSRARRSAEKLGVDNVDFREGRAEALPIDDASVDLAISNGVLNLVPDKLRAYQEIHRVLRPGGRFQVADIVVEKPIPEGTRRDVDLWAG